MQADGRSRVLGYTRAVGDGGVTYFALGHCHSPASRGGRSGGAAETVPAVFRGAWDNEAFLGLLRNTIAWGVAPGRAD